MKHARIAAFVIAFCVFAGALLNAAYRHFVGPGSSGPRIACDIRSRDLGTLPDRGRFPCQFTVENRGNRPLVIQEVKAGCSSCLEILEFPRKPLPPGGSGILRVAFSTEDLQGNVTKGLVVRSNDPQQPALVLRVTAQIDDPDASHVQTEVGNP